MLHKTWEKHRTAKTYVSCISLSLSLSLSLVCSFAVFLLPLEYFAGGFAVIREYTFVLHQMPEEGRHHEQDASADREHDRGPEDVGEADAGQRAVRLYGGHLEVNDVETGDDFGRGRRQAGHRRVGHQQELLRCHQRRHEKAFLGSPNGRMLKKKNGALVGVHCLGREREREREVVDGLEGSFVRLKISKTHTQKRM